MGKKAAPAAVVSPEPQEEEKKEDVGEQLQGEFQFADGSSYTGWYKKVEDNVCMHGEGLLHTGPESFEGTFEKGLYKQGTYRKTGINGKAIVYSGSFHENQYHGFGEYFWPDGRAYKGMWQNGLMHGRGVFLNFSFGVDREYKGFALDGKFSSNREEQIEMKRKFVTKYRLDYGKSASSALTSLAGAMGSDFFVPVPPPEGEEEKPELAAERDTIAKLVFGPFPEKDAVQQPLLQAFAAKLDEEKLTITVYEDIAQSPARLDVKRLQKDQLQHVGQCVEFVAAEAEVGQLSVIVLANVSGEYDVEQARWKLIHHEDVPQPGS